MGQLLQVLLLCSSASVKGVRSEDVLELLHFGPAAPHSVSSRRLRLDTVSRGLCCTQMALYEMKRRPEVHRPARKAGVSEQGILPIRAQAVHLWRQSCAAGSA